MNLPKGSWLINDNLEVGIPYADKEDYRGGKLTEKDGEYVWFDPGLVPDLGEHRDAPYLRRSIQRVPELLKALREARRLASTITTAYFEDKPLTPADLVGKAELLHRNIYDIEHYIETGRMEDDDDYPEPTVYIPGEGWVSI